MHAHVWCSILLFTQRQALGTQAVQYHMPELLSANVWLADDPCKTEHDLRFPGDSFLAGSCYVHATERWCWQTKSACERAC